MPTPAGRFIVFEGIEGAGKSTQLKRLSEWLSQSPWMDAIRQSLAPNAVPLMVTREPGGTALGQALRRLLLDSALTAEEGLPDVTELLLYAADRAQHVYTTIRPALEQGTLVLCDRYVASTIAYQGYGRGLSASLIEQLNSIATGGLQSDLTLWLDLEVPQGLTRARERRHADVPLQGSDRMEAEDLAFHQRVKQGFFDLAQANPESMVRINASGTETDVASRIQAVMIQHLERWYPLA
ncbi:MAG TPA: dTMP kinase [Stenomitos sp.]